VGQGRILGQQIFIVYVNGTWRNIDLCIRLFVEECIIYRKIKNKNNIEKLRKDLNTLGEWAVENWMKKFP